jgi:hypothetical protein
MRNNVFKDNAFSAAADNSEKEIETLKKASKQ